MNTLFKTQQTNEEELYCVYCHRNKINGKRYFGQTKHQDDPSRGRWGQNGEGYFPRGKKKLSHFANSISKYGWDNFEHIIIQCNLTKEEADELEDINIVAFNTLDPKFGYNEKRGGSNGALSDNARQKIRDALSNPSIRNHLSEIRKINSAGEKYSNYGKHWDTKHRQLISKRVSEAQFGVVWLHNSNKEIQVKQEEVDYYLQLGWLKGRKFDKVWIHNDTKTKMVRQCELQSYLDNGWLRGRFNSHKEAIDMFKKKEGDAI